eukprot:jgi/Mesen1/5773/ME000293S04928
MMQRSKNSKLRDCHQCPGGLINALWPAKLAARFLAGSSAGSASWRREYNLVVVFLSSLLLICIYRNLSPAPGTRGLGSKSQTGEGQRIVSSNHFSIASGVQGGVSKLPEPVDDLEEPLGNGSREAAPREPGRRAPGRRMPADSDLLGALVKPSPAGSAGGDGEDAGANGGTPWVGGGQEQEGQVGGGESAAAERAGGGWELEGEGEREASASAPASGNRTSPRIGPYSAFVPGTAIRSRRGVEALEGRLRCLAERGRWALNSTARWIPWDVNTLTSREQPDYKTCDRHWARKCVRSVP